jgi:hypothetical protein
MFFFQDSPVFVYIHGGYWQMLSKDISAYHVIPLWQAGIRSIVVGYDLTPKGKFSPALVQLFLIIFNFIFINEILHRSYTKNHKSNMVVVHVT